MLKTERNIAIFGLSNMLFSHRHKGSFPGPVKMIRKRKGKDLGKCERAVTPLQLEIDERRAWECR